MMAEEHQLAPVNRQQALQAGSNRGIFSHRRIAYPPPALSAVRGHDEHLGFSILIAGFTLFLVGAYKARMTVGHAGKSGFEMAIIGTASALWVTSSVSCSECLRQP